MHFDAFWTLAGTTAPVIALANVVVLTPAIRMISVFLAKPNFTASQRSEARYGKTFLGITYVLTCLNLGLQASVLYTALESLKSGQSDNSALTVMFEVGGLIIIVVVTLASAMAQSSAARLARSERALDPATRANG